MNNITSEAATIYKEYGYKSRAHYLQSLSEDYDVPLHVVQALADLYGPLEDFDALVTEIESIEGVF